MGARQDVVILGAGPAGSCLALYLLRYGYQPLIIEQAEFPRYHIGESLIGECANMLRELGLGEYMQAAKYPVRRGAWVWGDGGKNKLWIPVKNRDERGNLQDSITWQVRREEFDETLLNTAIERGAATLSAKAVDVLTENNRVIGLVVEDEQGERRQIKAAVTADASGQNTFLSSKGVCSRKIRGQYTRQMAFFTQMTGVVREAAPNDGNTQIFYGGTYYWAWLIPLSDTLTSVGVVASSDRFKKTGLDPEAFLQASFKTLNPALTRSLSHAVSTQPLRSASNYSYDVKDFTGPGFLCVGDAHGFIDPIFSFGIFLAMKEASMAAAAIKACFEGGVKETDKPFAAYQEKAAQGQSVIKDLIDTFWKYPYVFQMLVHHLHQEDFYDIFAGRIYQDKNNCSKAMLAMQQLLAD